MRINMIRYYSIIAVLLICSRSTNAGNWLDGDSDDVKRHITEEKTFLKSHGSKTTDKAASSENRNDIVCDALPDEKQTICDEIMPHLIKKYHGDVFVSLVDMGPRLPVPPSGDPYKCKEKFVVKSNMRKPMFWCMSRQFNKKQSDDKGWMDGFYCAGSLQTVGRVFAFKPNSNDPQRVSVVGELDNVGVILQKVGRRRGSK